MNGYPDWLPPLIELNDFGGDWQACVETVYQRFCADFVGGKVLFRGRKVVVRKHPIKQGKEHGFWHCVSEGPFEDLRTPDFARCARIGWIKAIIEAQGNKPQIEYWVERSRGQVDHCLWFAEEFQVILSERGSDGRGGPNVYLLKTSMCTFREHQKRKKRRARDNP